MSEFLMWNSVYIFLIGRIIFGMFFVMMGLNHFKKRKMMAEYGKSKGAPVPEIMVPATGLMMLLGGLGVILGVYVYMSLALLLAFLIPTSFIMHRFWKETDQQAKTSEMVNFTKNMALVGALLMMFMLGTNWALSVSF